MEIIRAAHTLTIELGPTRWRLVNGTQDPEQPDQLIALLEAREGRITCAPSFARARQLPDDGQLAPADVARVVVGWAPESRNWHLGLLLAARPDTGFKMRWCGLASWPSGAPSEHLTQAKLAGQSLARIIDRPFHLVPAPAPAPDALSDTQPLQPTMRLDTEDLLSEAPQIAPQEPPFLFESWAMLAVPKGYVWQRQGKWLLGMAFRGITLGVLTMLFLILGIGARTRGLANVNPDWLPTLGIAVAVVLGGIAVYNLWALLTVTDVLIDTTAREVRRQRRFSMRVTWRIPFDAVAYVVVSQTPARPQGRRHKGDPMRTAQDVWLHLYDGSRFWPVAELGTVEGLCHTWDAVRHLMKERGRRTLNLARYDTPAHHAAQATARALGTELWLDVR